MFKDVKKVHLTVELANGKRVGVEGAISDQIVTLDCLDEQGNLGFSVLEEQVDEIINVLKVMVLGFQEKKKQPEQANMVFETKLKEYGTS